MNIKGYNLIDSLAHFKRKPDMLLKKHTIIFLFFFVLITGCKQSTIDKIKNESNENSLFILNDRFVLLEPSIFLDKIEENSIIEMKIINSDSIEYKNAFNSIIKIQTDSSIQSIFNKSKWIEYIFLKKVNPQNNPLYMVDGMPIHDYNTVQGYLTNRIITKLNFISSNQAIAIWGKREGQNGAIQIWTEKNKDETIIPVIIKK